MKQTIAGLLLVVSFGLLGWAASADAQTFNPVDKLMLRVVRAELRINDLQNRVERLEANDRAQAVTIKRLCEEVGIPPYRCPTIGLVRL
jgi:hypothetical protein